MTDVSDFGQRIPYLLRRVGGALSQRLDADLKPYGLTQAQLSALALLGQVRPRSLSGAELSQRSGLTPQSMHTAVAGLVERDLVERSPHPTHGRIIESRLTAAGAALLLDVQTATYEAEGRYVGGLDADQQEQLRGLLRAMMVDLGLHLPEQRA
ncbi:DNA-binding transcriptional regulator, MarR family [Nocardioides exalbidus]|uniref:DNA-binding transcriptional regulator, MarR family n=1 Tax=Nocardioides exalbidus TaxID=402596 RepID=A0A1H4NCS4_9ACTN|nr:MarR family transcriptional regulator [Nocardioides exalbidus]SEB93039.1 DNA-binding transcriptional regulator, MarR family [Nocardioides exalbidus]